MNWTLEKLPPKMREQAQARIAAQSRVRTILTPDDNDRKSKATTKAQKDVFSLQLRGEGIRFEREYKFHPTRRWRFDYAILWPHFIAIEIDGGVWVNGRHNRGSGYVRDMAKFNAAAAMNWRILKYTPDQVKRGEAIKGVLECLK